jgi:hypothetical protein
LLLPPPPPELPELPQDARKKAASARMEVSLRGGLQRDTITIMLAKNNRI